MRLPLVELKPDHDLPCALCEDRVQDWPAAMHWHPYYEPVEELWDPTVASNAAR